jgi:hypothetical protein
VLSLLERARPRHGPHQSRAASRPRSPYGVQHNMEITKRSHGPPTCAVTCHPQIGYSKARRSRSRSCLLSPRSRVPVPLCHAGPLGRRPFVPASPLSFPPYDFLTSHLSLLTSSTRGAVRFPRQVKQLLADVLTLHDRHEVRQVSTHGLAVARGRLEKRCDRLLEWARADAANERLSLRRREIGPTRGLTEPRTTEGTSSPALREPAARPAASLLHGQPACESRHVS